MNFQGHFPTRTKMHVLGRLILLQFSAIHNLQQKKIAVIRSTKLKNPSK